MNTIELAKNCGGITLGDQSYFTGLEWKDDPRLVMTGDSLESFRAACVEEARKEENEECAKLGEAWGTTPGRRLAELIRARMK